MKDKKRKSSFCSDTNGFSTVIDIFLFLVMVSISAVILVPAMTGNTQVKSLIESKNQKQSSQLLLTLLNGRVDEFEYIVAGEQMDALAGDPINKSSVYLTSKKLIAGHELKHRTFADLAVESAASQWVIYHKGRRIQLNFLMSDYSSSLDGILKDYLDRQIGDRYNYNFTVVWRPVVNIPVGGDVSIGEPVPNSAFTESTYITTPYHVNFTRKRVEAIVDNSFNSSFGNISATFDEIKKNGTNRTLIEYEISSEINELINNTVDEAIAEIVDEVLTPVLDKAQSTMIEQVDNLLPNNSVLLNVAINDMINTTLQEENFSINGTMSSKLTLYLQEVAKQEIHEVTDDDMSALVTELADMYVNNVVTIDGIKERIITEIFSRISISRAKVTLAVWEKNV